MIAFSLANKAACAENVVSSQVRLLKNLRIPALGRILDRATPQKNGVGCRGNRTK